MKRHATPALAGLIESFFRHRLAAQRRASPATIAAYRDALRLLLVFAAERLGKRPVQLEVRDLDRDMVLSFLDFLEKERGNSVRTRNARLATIRSFFQHVTYSDPAAVGMAQRIISIPSKRATRKVISYLSRHEASAVLAVPDRTTEIGRRDHALLLFLLRTGARVSEAISVDVADLRLDGPTQVLVHGKGGKDRIVPLVPELASTLAAFLRAKPRERQRGPLFTSARGERLSRWGVNHIVAQSVAAAAEHTATLRGRSVTPHLLRHTTAMDLLQAGVDLTTIRSVLGHASEATTHHYVEANTEMKRAALAKGQQDEAAAMETYEPPDELLHLLEKL